MEERLRFVARLLDSEPMTALCREFGISRKTGYKRARRLTESHNLKRRKLAQMHCGPFCV